MSVISEFGDRVTTKFGEISASVDGIVADVTLLKAKIEQLQNSSGVISAEDQALLNSLENIVGGIASKVKALDDQTTTVPTPEDPAVE